MNTETDVNYRQNDFDSDSMLRLFGAIYGQIKRDYKTLWYVKNHYINGGDILIKDHKTKHKTQTNIDPYLIMYGINSTVNDEIKYIESYIKRITPQHGNDIIEHLRKESNGSKVRVRGNCKAIA